MSKVNLLTLLQKKRNFFEAILELTEMESSLPLSEWIEVLEQKKILLSCIEEIDSELGNFKDSLTALSQDISEELDLLKDVIGKILHLDSLNCVKRKEEFHIPPPNNSI